MTDANPVVPAALAAATLHRFVSPHYDDIALSCGGTVALLSGAGRSAAIDVVFGAEPDPDESLTTFAQELHRGWGLDAGTVVAARRAEEAEAARLLGVPSTVLPFRDAIYRGGHYLGNDQLFGEAPVAAEKRLPRAIASRLLDVLPESPRQGGGARIYAPLGIGRHVDHQLAFRAAAELAAAGWQVWFYEDLPYAIRPGALEARLAALAPTYRLDVAATIDVGRVWDTKIAAILVYPSQLATVFDYVDSGSTAAEIDATMRRYAQGVGGRIVGERFWRLEPGAAGAADAALPMERSPGYALVRTGPLHRR